MKTLLILFAVLTFASCEKQKEEIKADTDLGTVTFWTTEFSLDNSSVSGWLLWVDGVRIGTINKPYVINTTDDIPVCGDKRFTTQLLTPGKHSYHLTCFILTQAPPNYFVGQTYYFDVTTKGCVIIRATQ